MNFRREEKEAKTIEDIEKSIQDRGSNLVITDDDFDIRNEEFFLAEDVWYRGEITNVAMTVETNQNNKNINKFEFTFKIKDLDTNQSQEAKYTCIADFKINKNKGLQKIVVATLGRIPQGAFNLRKDLLGKKATFKIKSYNYNSKNTIINYITEFK